MKNFLTWLLENTHNISIDLSRYQNDIKIAADELLDYIRDREYELEIFDLDEFVNQVRSKFKDYPDLQELLSNIEMLQIDPVFESYKKVRDWVNQKPYQEQSKYYDTLKKFYTLMDYIVQDEKRNPEEGIRQSVSNSISQTKVEMQKISELISSAISRIANWNHSPIIIQPLIAQDEYGKPSLEPTTAAEISVGTIASFTLFRINNRIEIDDIIEADDTDFFEDPRIKSDYFVLINELRKPGSTAVGKVLTLYTARPRRDRNRYLNANTLPENIFLTNSLSHAEGLAHDLATDEPRDIWRVRIDSRYLTQTLEGNIKYYQVTVPNAPIKSIDLLTP